MSKFKKLPSDYWVHEDMASIVFPKKPPDWIAEYIVRVYHSGYHHGEMNVKNSIREAMSFIVPDDE